VAALSQAITETPVAAAAGPHRDRLRDLIAAVASVPQLAALQSALERSDVQDLIAGTFASSPYLQSLIERDPERLQRILCLDSDDQMQRLQQSLATAMAEANDLTSAMRALRRYKSEAALLIALADLSGHWPVMQATAALSQVADTALQDAVRFLLKQAQTRGDWRAADPAHPEAGTGYIVLAMGKHGARELNYSSDIDLIVFFDHELAPLRDPETMQSFFVRLTRDLVRLMEERTADGYVFRTDLRLRPDAGATQLAIATSAALVYYESFGQNWERAALIKARAVAGDIEAGEALLQDLAPFVWRKYLDFAAIADVHAMKRQINSVKGFGAIAVAGHNIKLGAGGIREIDFFAQTQQLIAGGRQRDLRVRETLIALQLLVSRGWITDVVRDDLSRCYGFLRRIEHRLQMMRDEQTQELPSDDDQLLQLAHFSGYADTAAFAEALTEVLETVQRHYRVLFESSPELTTAGANMVFAGEDDDPGTLAALSTMGFTQPSSVLATVRGWHHGRYAAVRSPRARERLTEVQPQLIAAFGASAEPDHAFMNFDRFLSELPEGVQLFSLLSANPNLVRLVAEIMGTAPRLARTMSRRRRVLDAVLDPKTFSALPTSTDLDAILQQDVPDDAALDQVFDSVRVIGQEQGFLTGVRVLTGTVHAGQAGAAYARLAGALIGRVQRAIEADMIRAHGHVAGGQAVVIAMGKLGGFEMTAASDLDLIILYDFDPEVMQSSGPKPLAPGQYYARYTQRLISGLSVPTSEGQLYDVDMRLRPSGQKGPLATSLTSFISYHTGEAWTWEHLALTRARVISGPKDLSDKVKAAIHETLIRARERGKIAADVLEMRRLLMAEKGTTNSWNIKQVRGGLIDVEFIAQYLQLIHANAHPSILDTNTLAALSKLAAAGCLDQSDAETLIAAGRLLQDLGQIQRLCSDADFDPASANHGLKNLLVQAAHAPSFTTLEAELGDRQAAVHALFDRLVK
jgi:[glutamine synthetase] adenylyltransferase / [glutamine synthetase]-adenylyl-L-tyrosine phosphorylase